MIQSLLKYCAECLEELGEQVAPELRKLAIDSNLKSRTLPERWFIDVNLEVWGGEGKVALGIENKLDAVGRHQQLKALRLAMRYQPQLEDVKAYLVGA